MINNELFTQLANAVRFDECLTVLGLKDDGLFDIVQMLTYDKVLQEKFSKQIGKRVIIESFGIRLLEDLLQDPKESNILDLLGLHENLQKIFTGLLDQPDKVVLLVSDIDKLTDFAKAIAQFDELLRVHPGKISFIYLLENVELFLQIQSKLESNSSFFENTYIQPLKGSKERQSLESICGKKYGELKSKKKLGEIFRHSFGHYELYKRLYKAEVTGNFESLDNYVKRLVASFGKSALRIFRKMINGIELSSTEEEIIKLYEELGFVTKQDIVIPLLKKYIRDITPREEFSFDKNTGAIFMESIHNFSKSEVLIIRTFLEHAGEIVTKEDLGRVLWGSRFLKRYSPWAIDQLIFRLRLKIDKLHIAGSIKTVHGKGYVFNR